MSTSLNGLAAQAVIQGNKPAAMLTGITPKYGWDSTTNRKKENIDSLALDVVSPSTRFNKVTVIVPVEGCSLGITDADLEIIAQTGGAYPFVKFDGLTARFWSSKENSAVQISATASKSSLCDENGGITRKQ